MSLPNPSMSFSPFAILTAEEVNDLVENIESLSDGSGFDDGAISAAKIATIPGRKQANTTNSIANGLRIQMGTGLISGAATADLSEDITFPVAFSSTPTVVANAIGYKSAGGGTYDPSTISDDWSGQTAIAIKPAATGFKVRMRRIDNLSYASGTDYYYNWIAVGEA